jgi:hypothetical protein
METQELVRLDNLAKSLVIGRPIFAAVGYDERTARLSVHLRSSLGSRDCSPSLMDHDNLQEYVRRQVADFVAHMED